MCVGGGGQDRGKAGSQHSGGGVTICREEPSRFIENL